MNSRHSNKLAAPTWRMRIVAVCAVAVAMTAIACGGSSNSNDTDDSDAIPSGEAKYVASVDEGLGAAIAIVVDNSGSMNETAGDDSRPKYIVAREALESVIATTDSFVQKQPGFPIKVGLIRFSGEVQRLLPVAPYDREALRGALSTMTKPSGGTAIGSAIDAAREELYKAGTIRKYILVITDGENTVGRSPRVVAREIFRRSEGAIKIYFVAFDVDAKKFEFLRDIHGDVLGASNGVALRASLDTIYTGRILAEAADAGERKP